MRRALSCLGLFSVLILMNITSANATEKYSRYDLCKNAQQSLACAVGFEKVRTIYNPITKTKFFEDGVHIKSDKIANFPKYYVSQPDLDNDGVREIIVSLNEENPNSKGLICKSKYQCPHFVIQNRNPNPKQPRLKYFTSLGVIYANGVGVSTDEVIDNYKSLRVYKSGTTSQFDVYQYDKKNDEYFNISGRR